jgi:methionyl-tRNA formyltransferase
MRSPFILLTDLSEEDKRPERELISLLLDRGIVSRVVTSNQEVRELSNERVLMMNWLRRIRREVIQRNCMIFNLHNSILPRYRGRHAFAWALIHGEREVGYTLHAIDQTFDTGPIYAQCRFPIGPEDDINDVFARGHAIVRAWLPDVLECFDAGLLKPIPQDDRLASYYPARTEEDGRIEWGQTAEAIRNLVRAIRPPYTPGAFFTTGGRTFRVDRCIAETNGAKHPPGLVLKRDVKRNAIEVACGDGVVRLLLAYSPGAPTAQDLRHPVLLD